MISRRIDVRRGLSLALALLPGALWAEGQRVRPRVLYATVDEIYIDAGTLAGLSPGDPGALEGGGPPRTRVEVVDASRASARLRVLGPAAETVRAGDTVVMEASFREKPIPPSDDFVPLLSPRAGKAPVPAARESRFHGSLRLRHLAQQDEDDRSSYGLSRLELNSGVTRVGGSSWSFMVDGNVSYRTGEAFRDSLDYREARYDAYRLVAEGPLGGHGTARFGRFAPAELPGFGFIDGLLLQARAGRTRWGLVGGARPRGADRRPSGERPAAGLYVAHVAPDAARLRHEGTVGVLVNTHKGELDRLALLCDERLRLSSRWSAGLSLEADKRVDPSTGTPPAQLTRLNFHARWTPGKNFSLSGGADRHQDSLTRPSDTSAASNRRYLRYWAGAGQYLGAGWRAEGDVSFYAATQDESPTLWRGGLTKTGLPGLRGGYVTANIYNLGGGGLEGLGAQASAGLPFWRGRVYLAPSVRARDAARTGEERKWTVLDYGARADWRADPLTFYAGGTRTEEDGANATLVEAGVDFRW